MAFRSSEILRQRLEGRSNSFVRKRLLQNQRSHSSYYTRHFIVGISEQSLPASLVVIFFVVILAIIIIIIFILLVTVIIIIIIVAGVCLFAKIVVYKGNILLF